MSKPETVESYITNAPTEAQSTLEELHEIITSIVPEAEEGIRYNVPFYEFYGAHMGFTAFKNHATFGIGADALQSEDRQLLEEQGYKTGKETIQIKYDQAVPTKEISRLLEAKVEAAKSTQ